MLFEEAEIDRTLSNPNVGIRIEMYPGDIQAHKA
jgi:hypothetical protein